MNSYIKIIIYYKDVYIQEISIIKYKSTINFFAFSNQSEKSQNDGEEGEADL